MRWHVALLACVLEPWSLQHAAADPRETVLEAVLVTAQHREESAHSTPISLFTLDSEQLEKQRVSNISNLNGLVPNLNIDGFPANNQTLRVFIRGVGLTDTQLTQDAAVGVYLNDVYIARSTGLAFDVADLERIEVLRGPQGTLYGRNTTGGAIRLITRRPDINTLTFDQTLGLGNQDLLRSKTSVNVPLAEHYAARFAYFYEDVDGFVKNGGAGGSWGDRESEGFRLDLRADFSEQLTLDYAYDRSRIEYFNLPAQAVLPREPGTSLLAVVGSVARQYIQYDNNRINRLSSTVPLLPTDTTITGHALNIDWAASDALTLRSISAWRELTDKSYLDFASGASEGFRIDFNAAVLGAEAGAARQVLPVGRPDLEQEQFSQEFQALGRIGDSLEYLAGVYLFSEKAREDARPTRHIFSVFPFGGGTLYNTGSEYNEIDNEAWAFFSQLTWTPDILERRLHLTLGWRHSEDSRDAVRRVTDEVVIDRVTSLQPVIPESNFAADTGDNYDDDSYTLIAEYEWTENYNLYAKYAEAYKSGGFNIRDPEEAGFSDGFTEEKLRSLEAGFKGELLNRMLRVNAAVFHQRFDDFQYNFQIPGTIQNTRVLNVDEGEMSGVELELTAMPSAGLFLQFNYAYLHSELDDVINPFTNAPQSFSFTNAPEQTYSLVADYSFPVRPLGGLLSLNAGYHFVGDRQKDIDSLYRDDYALINARLSLSEIEALGGQWSIAAWGKNLQDSDYEAFTLDNLPQASRAVIWGDGTTLGVDIHYHFR